MEVQGMHLRLASRCRRLLHRPWDAVKAERPKQNLKLTLRTTSTSDGCVQSMKVVVVLVHVGALGGMILAVPGTLKRLTTMTEEADRQWTIAVLRPREEDN